MEKLKNIIFWISTILSTLFFVLLTFICYNEWWTVKIKKQIKEYPWGTINENPWYYKTPDIYSTVMFTDVMFTEGFLFTIALIILIIQLLKMKKVKILYSIMLYFGLFILMIASSLIN